MAPLSPCSLLHQDWWDRQSTSTAALEEGSSDVEPPLPLMRCLLETVNSLAGGIHRRWCLPVHANEGEPHL